MGRKPHVMTFDGMTGDVFIQISEVLFVNNYNKQ